MQLEVGEIYEGKVTSIAKFGAFISFEGGQTGMVHISEIAPVFVIEIKDFLTEGQTVKAKVLEIGKDGKISLSIKKALPEEQQKRAKPEAKPRKEGRRAPREPRPAPQPSPGRPGDFEWQSRRNDSGSFEDMMSRFKQTSDEKISDLKRSRNDPRRSYNRKGGGGKTN